jgi:hypothetical protein
MLDEDDDRDMNEPMDAVAVVIGCGPVSLFPRFPPLYFAISTYPIRFPFPTYSANSYETSANEKVGLCCISSAKTMFKTVYATDPSPQRRALAEKHGAIALPLEDLSAAILKATDGRGADVALELVGNEAALKTSMDLIRPFGAVSSIGMHIKPLNLSGEYLYDKK